MRENWIRNIKNEIEKEKENVGIMMTRYGIRNMNNVKEKKKEKY